MPDMTKKERIDHAVGCPLEECGTCDELSPRDYCDAIKDLRDRVKQAMKYGHLDPYNIDLKEILPEAFDG